MIWFALVFVFLIIEAMTLNLVTIWFGFGSLCAFISCYFTDNIIIQLSVFAGATLISLLLTRPILEKFLKTTREKTNCEEVIGKLGIVTKDIKKYDNGRVKLLGKEWMAISKDEIKKGSEVEILQIEGVKLVVRKKVQ